MSAPVSTTPDAAAAAATAASRFNSNAAYMAGTIEKVASCAPVGSGGLTAQYSPGQVLLFNVPVANNAFLRALRFTFNMTVTLPSQTVSALTASGPWSLFSELAVNFNGVMVRTHPYIPAVALQRVKRYNAPQSNGLVTNGYQDSQVQSMLRSSFPVATGANTWLFTLDLPLNVLQDLDPSGMLPIMGTTNPVQISLTCNPAPFGVDPLLNAVTTNAVAPTVTGTVTCDAAYRDGSTLYSPAKLPLDISGNPTVQWAIDNRVTNLQAGTLTKGQLKTQLRHYYLFAIIIDGNQSSAFATSNNIVGMELDPDATGNNPILRFGQGTNVSISEYFREQRRVFGQDSDPGVIPWVTAPAKHQPDASNQLGNMVLNMMPDGWTTVYQGYQLNTIGGVNGITPRVETFVISANPMGLLG